MKFKYKGKIYSPVHLEKKLRKLGISLEDVEIIEYDEDLTQKPKELEDIPYYFFKNKYTNEIIISIYDNLNDMIYNNELGIGIKGFNINDWMIYEN